MAGKDTEVAAGTTGAELRAVTGTGILTAMHAVMTAMAMNIGIHEGMAETATTEMLTDILAKGIRTVTLIKVATSSCQVVGIEVPEQRHQITCHRSITNPAAVQLQLMDACFHVQIQWQGRLPLTHI